jgi:hypothetical protein
MLIAKTISSLRESHLLEVHINRSSEALRWNPIRIMFEEFRIDSNRLRVETGDKVEHLWPLKLRSGAELGLKAFLIFFYRPVSQGVDSSKRKVESSHVKPDSRMR